MNFNTEYLILPSSGPGRCSATPWARPGALCARGALDGQVLVSAADVVPLLPPVDVGSGGKLLQVALVGAGVDLGGAVQHGGVE